jgi:hypothetical protein
MIVLSRKFSLALFLHIPLYLPAFSQQTGGLTSAVIVEKPVREEDFPIVSLDDASALLRYDNGDSQRVIRKVIVNNGGYEQTYLKMPESPYQRQ